MLNAYEITSKTGDTTFKRGWKSKDKRTAEVEALRHHEKLEGRTLTIVGIRCTSTAGRKR